MEGPRSYLVGDRLEELLSPGLVGIVLQDTRSFLETGAVKEVLRLGGDKSGGGLLEAGLGVDKVDLVAEGSVVDLLVLSNEVLREDEEFGRQQHPVEAGHGKGPQELSLRHETAEQKEKEGEEGCTLTFRSF